MGTEAVERTEELVDRGRQLAGGTVGSVGRQIGPENGVVDVSSEVERQVLLEFVDGSERVVRAGFFHLLERGVRACHIRGVVLGVVQLHDARGDVRLERGVVVREFGK